MATATPVHVTPERIMQMAWGYIPPLVLEAAIRHHVFDVLDGGPKTIPEVEKATGASARGLTAIMNALVGLEFLSKDKQGRYALTPESAAFLVSTKPSFQGGLIKHCSENSFLAGCTSTRSSLPAIPSRRSTLKSPVASSSTLSCSTSSP